MTGNPKTAKIAYELRKLRERGAIKKCKSTNNYTLTKEGYVWIYYALIQQDHFLNPLLSIHNKKTKKTNLKKHSNIEKAQAVINDAIRLITNELNIAV